MTVELPQESAVWLHREMLRTGLTREGQLLRSQPLTPSQMYRQICERSTHLESIFVERERSDPPKKEDIELFLNVTKQVLHHFEGKKLLHVTSLLQKWEGHLNALYNTRS